MKTLGYSIILLLLLILSEGTVAQVGMRTLNDPPYFGLKLTHFSSGDYAVLACDKRSGEFVLRTKQGIDYRSFNYNDIISTSNKVGQKYASLVSAMEKRLQIKYEVATFNLKVAQVYGRYK